MVIYIVSVWDKGEHTVRNEWYYDNRTAALQRIEYEAQKYDDLVKLYDGSYDEKPDDPNDGISIRYTTTKLESEFKVRS